MTAWHEHEAELRGWLRYRLAKQGERFCAITNARACLYEVARNALADRLRRR